MFSLILFAALIPGQTPTAVVELHDGGMLFPACLQIDQGQKSAKTVPYYGHKTVILTVPVGVHTFEIHNSRFGFPQSAEYVRLTKDGKEVWKSEKTVDPRRVELQAGQTLRIDVLRPYEPYDAKFGMLRGVPVGFVFPRPYWFQDVDKEWKGKEDYPNSLFFLVDTQKWGPEKVFGQLAAHVVKSMDDPAYQGAKEDYRAQCHATFICGLDADGNVPKAFKEAKRTDLEKEIGETCLQLFNQWKSEKCYRAFPPRDIAALKENGWLSKEAENGRTAIPVSRGLELAETELKKWKEKNKK